MEFFLLPIPVWLVVIIYLLSLAESILGVLRYMGHWGILLLQAGSIAGYTIGMHLAWGTVESLGTLQYALLVQVFIIIISVYGFYRWYQVSAMYWKYQFRQTEHVLDNSIENNQFKPYPAQFLTFSHYVALTFVVIVLWLFLARIYSMEISMRASNQGLVGLMAFVLTLHYVGNFLLANFFMEGWVMRAFARLIEILFLIYRDMGEPLLIGLLSAMLVVNIWGWWRFRASIIKHNLAAKGHNV